MVPMEMGVIKFELAEGKVYGSRYYTVQPKYYNIDWYGMLTWIEETFGPSEGSIWFDKNVAPEAGQRWYTNNSKFWFKNKADRDWFLLRWE